MHQAIQQTRQWLEQVVIAHTFCPFAQREFEQDRIYYHIMAADFKQSLMELEAEIQRLDQENNIETSLLIYPQSLDDFEEFLDYHHLVEHLLQQLGYEGIYQVATFHPHYCFADATNDNPANYTNRSPYPTLHILREASVEKALQNYPNPESIPERNIKYARVEGIDKMRDSLARICTHEPR